MTPPAQSTEGGGTPPDLPLDPFGVLPSFARVNQMWLNDAAAFSEKLTALGEGLRQANADMLSRFFPEDNGGQAPAPAGEDALLTFSKKLSASARQYHALFSAWLADYIDQTPDADPEALEKTKFWAAQALSMAAPSNYFWTNPGAVQRWLKSDGESLKAGAERMLEDMARADGLLKLADDSAFVIGGNIATTPGGVVFRNDLMELIQYAPATDAVFRTPVVLIQPWINKYYIFDLSPANSLVRFLIRQGFTVFITSWKNPGPELRRKSFADYVMDGALAAVHAAREICGVDQVHAAGYCIGGTALAALMAWLARTVEANAASPAADWTLFSTLADFSEPGVLKMFTGEDAVAYVEKLMAADGCLDKKYLSLAFRLLNPDALIWRYVVNNYLYGQPPPKSDMLFWNSDGTRLPEAMCSFYLREFYRNNRLARKDAMILDGAPLDLGRIRQPLYCVGARQDHISPWTGAFKTVGLTGGPVRCVLSSEGHITGIVNPPSERSRKKYWADDPGRETDAETWLSRQEARQGSWWPDWVGWLARNEKNRRKPPPMGNADYPVLASAPGRYVHEP